MKIICGYNVNIDSVYRISGTEVNELLETQDRGLILEKIKNPPGVIRSVPDFLAGLILCMKEGTGAEWLVLERPVFDFLKNRFYEKSLVRLGGNAGIMANVLSHMGANLVVPNIAVPSKTQLSLFTGKSILFPDFPLPEKGPKKPRQAGPQEGDPVHFVFDFSKGDTFRIFGTEISVPRENRFIATCDQPNLSLFINPAFDKYAKEHISELDGALISGFHILLENYPDGSTYLEKLEAARAQISSWKAANRKLAVHLEFGHYGKPEIARAVFLKFAGLCDSIGMNEDELAMLGELHGVSGKEILQMDAKAVVKAAVLAASKQGLSRILIHTREFAVSAAKLEQPESGKDLPVDAAGLKKSGLLKELKALDFGVKCAGVFAATGRLNGREFMEKAAEKLEISSFGSAQAKKFIEAFQGIEVGEGAFACHLGYAVFLLPTRLSKSPISTVGLGDTLTAGIFLRRIELGVRA